MVHEICDGKVGLVRNDGALYARRAKPIDGINYAGIGGGGIKAVVDAIDRLRAAGVKCAVVSNKPDFAIADLMDHFFFGKFDFALGQRDNLKRKPDAEPVHFALQQIDVAPEDAVYIGDSEVDIATAQNSDMPCISLEKIIRKNMQNGFPWNFLRNSIYTFNGRLNPRNR